MQCLLGLPSVGGKAVERRKIGWDWAQEAGATTVIALYL